MIYFGIQHIVPFHNIHTTHDVIDSSPILQHFTSNEKTYFVFAESVLINHKSITWLCVVKCLFIYKIIICGLFPPSHVIPIAVTLHECHSMRRVLTPDYYSHWKNNTIEAFYLYEQIKSRVCLCWRHKSIVWTRGNVHLHRRICKPKSTMVKKIQSKNYCSSIFEIAYKSQRCTTHVILVVYEKQVASTLKGLFFVGLHSSLFTLYMYIVKLSTCKEGTTTYDHDMF